jgi:hypothetical protein
MVSDQFRREELEEAISVSNFFKRLMFGPIGDIEVSILLEIELNREGLLESVDFIELVISFNTTSDKTSENLSTVI